ncbi:MAG TPA: YCF48-related protein, partial [Terriglobia bacterium]|nr:YCF48-related protein [Terriglobia bacterium]
MALRRSRNTFLFVMICSFFFLTPFAKPATMKLLTPNVGWVIHYPGLMWTTDGGTHWKNITPPLANGQQIASVFFLDTQDGWALLSGQGEKGSDEPRFDLAVTNNAGAKWSIVPVVIPELNPRQTILDGSGQVDFVDPMRGWLNLNMTSSPNFSLAMLIETNDGGETWTRPQAAPGVSGDLSFINDTDGWLAGGPGNQFLYVTHDGSKTWKKMSLNPPAEVGGAVYPTFAGAPVFVESGRGFVAVNYSGPPGSP